jgi:Monodechloroaminopyrrolnitrin synthase PrnB
MTTYNSELVKIGRASRDTDPLGGFDPEMGNYLGNLPQYNLAGETRLIYSGLNRLVGVDVDNIYSPGIALRALGDLDMALGSARVHHKDPVSLVPGLAGKLAMYQEIAIKVDGGPDVPRGTFHTYASTQTPIEQQRTFTGLNEEIIFIGELEKTEIALERSFTILSAVDFARTPRDEIKDALRNARAGATQLKNSMAEVRRAFRPRGKGFFAHNIRQYFDPILVDGVLWDGPSAAATSWLLVEELMNGCDNEDEGFRAFFEKSVAYLPIRQRAMLETFIITNQGMSYRTYIRNLKHSHAKGDSADGYVMQMLYSDIMGEVIDFGKIHNRMADEDFEHRPDDSLGGAGYTPATLVSRHNQRLVSTYLM